MVHRSKLVVILGAMAFAALAAPGCGGGGTSGSNGGGGSGVTGGGGTGGGGTGGTGGVTGGTGGVTGGTGGTTGGGGTGGGGPTDLGAQATAFVNAGGQAKSANFSMVFTLGQSTQNQGVTTSANYRLQGGIIGATGSFE